MKHEYKWVPAVFQINFPFFLRNLIKSNFEQKAEYNFYSNHCDAMAAVVPLKIRYAFARPEWIWKFVFIEE